MGGKGKMGRIIGGRREAGRKRKAGRQAGRQEGRKEGRLQGCVLAEAAELPSSPVPCFPGRRKSVMEWFFVSH